jgi:hypothetical protein
VVRIVRCLVFPMQPRNCRTSSGLRTRLGQLLRLLWCRDDVLERPVFLQGDLVEKARRGYGDEHRARRQFLFVGEVDLIGADVLRAQLLWGSVEVACKQRDLLHVRRLRVRCEIPHLHVFGHALPKGCHSCRRGVIEAPLRNGMCCEQHPMLSQRSRSGVKADETLRELAGSVR